ncbi:MAG: hypothetical protein JXK04_03205 [Campylobacterales bacterium]|nr:hypothetical protein [Campylobacterales bacterium]
MWNVQNELQHTHETLLNTLRDMSIEHMILAKRAKMTMNEIMKCLEISKNHRLDLEVVFSKMAVFKQTSAHLLYKEDFFIA